MYFHGFKGGFNLVDQALTLLIGASGFWWRDVIREATIEGYHTDRVLVGLSWGMILFIVSEIMFFFKFFLGLFLF
jgi:heme/copper-type cytochrome/quinol oxidase subunit 3